ncbi:hypothetical protein SK128_010203 [Halocaridina rubra]|uniref:Uncharacterized protein n=1 Tax=Halocaridina rubra TaxID=373956 RepID=A0AAN8WBA5_HALRR
MLHLIYLEDSNFEWIGESEDGSLLCRWEEEVLVRGPAEGGNGDGAPGEGPSSLALATQLAVATPDLHSTQVLYTFDKVVPVVQASVNASRNLLGFVTRRRIGESNKYSAYVAEIAPQGGVFSLNIDSSRQIFLEFLHTEENGKPLGESWIAKLLVFMHRECKSNIYDTGVCMIILTTGGKQEPTEYFSTYEHIYSLIFRGISAITSEVSR